MSASQDGSESVDQFLARIASVRDGRDQVSEERTKRMEEDFLKNRKERQARRLERARSLSPSKTGPSFSSPIPQNVIAARDTALNPPVDFSPRASTLSRSNAVNARTSPKLESRKLDIDLFAKPQSTPSSPNSAANTQALSRSGTLSWQQRPPRDGVMNRPRPLSTIETIRPTNKSQENTVADEPERSRQEIAASLGSKDPSWFRQTQERGLGSAALRKNQVEDTATVEHTARSHVLPGLSTQAVRPTSSTSVSDPAPPPPAHATRLSPLPQNRPIREVSPTPASSTNLLPADPSPQQLLRLALSAEPVSSPLSRSGSILTGRSPSPTKGLGGFVESAMMKRSDSVNKRWSVQANSGLKRGDSIAGMRPISGTRSMHTSTLSRNSNRDDSPSPMPTSRPESRDDPTKSRPQLASTNPQPDLSVTNNSAQRSTTLDTTTRPKTPPDDELSRSPSKTFDSRRWSPTKSSWLESALLSKPEPPKPQMNRDEVPAWKANLQRSKSIRDKSPDKNKTTSDSPHIAELTDPKAVGKVPKEQGDGVESPGTTLNSKVQTKTKDMTQEQDTLASATTSEDAASTSPQVLSKIRADVKDEKLRGDKSDSPERNTFLREKTERKPPLVLKPKPQTPPKIDFRSTLRSRAPISNNDNGAEPEFKAVFGKLKSAQTQNYVAPDVLKTNILTGKAALNSTGGPQKTQRVDEFKESILQKKEAMKVSAVQKKENPVSQESPPKPQPELPEALARRKTLHKASPSITKLQGSFGTTQSKPAEPPKPVVPLKPKPTPTITQSSARNNSDAQIAPAVEPDKLKTAIRSFKAPDPDKSLSSAKPLANREGPETQQTRRTNQTISDHSIVVIEPVAVVPTPVTKAEVPPGSKLASRLNPSLAALLTRGSPHGSPGKPSSPERQSEEIVTRTVKEPSNEESAATGELTHMTKGRARGPKRRAPKAQATDVSSPQPSIAQTVTKSEPSVKQMSKSMPAKLPHSTKDTLAPATAKSIAPLQRDDSELEANARNTETTNKNFENSMVKTKAKPPVTIKSPELRRVSSTVSSPQTDVTSSGISNTKKFEIATDMTRDAITPKSQLPGDVYKTPAPPSTTSPLTPSKSRVNTPKQAQSIINPPAKPQNPKPIAGLGLSNKSLPAKPIVSPSELPPPPDRQTKLSPIEKTQSRNSRDDKLESIITAYFTKRPERQQRADFDAQALLELAKLPNEKIKTIAHNIWEIKGDGKKHAMPSQQEHILFEDSLYLLSHSFEPVTGSKSSEVYLWCGSDVASGALEDAQLFCRKDAREHNAKLEVVRQGKEPTRFFQALGGIIVTRRNRTSSLYMLRGRRHLGHLAFDEVDLSGSSLCSGFSYLISAKFGKLYLWKGQGSGADEVGCARLIGMDLGLTGEIEEVVEGQEPASFWESFPEGAKKEKYSDDWRQRAKHDCYPTTLYRVDLEQTKAAGGFWGLRAASPSKPSNTAAVELLSPLCDHDLEPSNVYVLDAYRSIYVLLHPQASSKSTEVVTALHLAQDLAMLSPSIQDRSLLPSCFVVFGEPPADVKVCFRKWSDGQFSKSMKPAGCFTLESVMKALDL